METHARSPKEEKKVEYLELIYDLIFVYIIGRNNSLLHDVSGGFVAPSMFAAYILCTLAIIQIWNFSTYYINMYGRNSLREHIFLFVNMYLLYFVAEGTRVHWQGFEMQYNIAWAAILCNIGLQYVIEHRNHKGSPVDQKRTKSMAIILFGEALMIVLSFVSFKLTKMLLTPLPIVFGIFGTMFSRRNGCAENVDFAHLSERAMLYVVFTFGEMIIAIASYFEGEMSLNRIYFSLMAFLIVVGLFLSYGTTYDRIIDREMASNGLMYMILHIFMIFALNNITTALEFMHDEAVSLIPKMIFLIVSFVIYYTFLFLAGGTHAKVKCRPTTVFYAKMTVIAVSFAVLMFLLRKLMYANIALTVLYVFAVFAVIYKAGRKSAD